MNPLAMASLAVFVAYLIGAIPFAYVFVRLAKGVDIRTVGSGNVGATNAARVLGLRGFLLVFLFDFLKGLLPTLLLPRLVAWRGGQAFADLPIFVALAAILGHNFPIYLNFRGGKGVSTSVGAAAGLDPIASLAAVLTFGVALRASRYVSLASMIGATAFAITHFLFVTFYERKNPFDREHVALSVLILGLLAMMIVRHRKNWARIRAGTEPKIGRRKRESGRASVVVLCVIVAAGIAAIAAVRMARTATLDCGAFTLVDLGRAKTGHQRATSPVFADDGKVLAVLCPRYNRLMIYRAEGEGPPRLARDVTLDGQPMGLEAAGDRLWVLERPAGDARHLKPGHVQGYTLGGDKAGPAIAVGFYPTAMALADGGRSALVLTAGRSEGDPHHGDPAMEVVDLPSGRGVARIAFDRPGDLPVRIAVAASGRAGAVALRGSNQVAAIDLKDARGPRVVGRSPLPSREFPYPSITRGDWILMPVDSDRECAVVASSNARRAADPRADFLATVRPDASEVEVRLMVTDESLGSLPLRGSANLGTIRPTGVACSPDRTRLAITSRSGGVHLVAIRPKPARAGGAPARTVASR